MSPKSFRVLGVVMLATAALTAIALPRIASPQAASEETIAQRESAHERREDHGLCVDGAAEHLGQELRPDDFINEGGRSRAEKQNENDPTAIG